MKTIILISLFLFTACNTEMMKDLNQESNSQEINSNIAMKKIEIKKGFSVRLPKQNEANESALYGYNCLRDYNEFFCSKSKEFYQNNYNYTFD